MRELLIGKAYELSKPIYQRLLKNNQPWNIKHQELLRYPENSLGFHLGCFLIKYNFEMQPQLEDHDVIHVLTNTGISVPEEIGMQFYLFGNGKRSLYMFMVLLSGTVFYPTKINYFKECYSKGKKAHRFYDLEFLKMLSQPISKITDTFKIS